MNEPANFLPYVGGASSNALMYSSKPTSIVYQKNAQYRRLAPYLELSPEPLRALTAFKQAPTSPTRGPAAPSVPHLTS